MRVCGRSEHECLIWRNGAYVVSIFLLSSPLLRTRSLSTFASEATHRITIVCGRRITLALEPGLYLRLCAAINGPYRCSAGYRRRGCIKKMMLEKTAVNVAC